MFQIVDPLEISRTSITGLQPTGCNANKLLSKFLEGDLKILKNFQEELSIGVPFYLNCRSTICNLQSCMFMKFRKNS